MNPPNDADSRNILTAFWNSYEINAYLFEARRDFQISELLVRLEGLQLFSEDFLLRGFPVLVGRLAGVSNLPSSILLASANAQEVIRYCRSRKKRQILGFWKHFTRELPVKF
jgi:hypothetical protein